MAFQLRPVIGNARLRGATARSGPSDSEFQRPIFPRLTGGSPGLPCGVGAADFRARASSALVHLVLRAWPTARRPPRRWCPVPDPRSGGQHRRQESGSSHPRVSRSGIGGIQPTEPTGGERTGLRDPSQQPPTRPACSSSKSGTPARRHRRRRQWNPPQKPRRDNGRRGKNPAPGFPRQTSDP